MPAKLMYVFLYRPIDAKSKGIIIHPLMAQIQILCLGCLSQTAGGHPDHGSDVKKCTAWICCLLHSQPDSFFSPTFAVAQGETCKLEIDDAEGLLYHLC